ncbi:hypothetical protein [Escherichia coli]|nr:hypothetical protein [Escherichia coli]MDZ8664455.1 hypothetical protein [Escherichia coli]WRX87725.1 hypothetical protein SM938_22625 [Escherichia coli]
MDNDMDDSFLSGVKLITIILVIISVLGILTSGVSLFISLVVTNG